LGPGIALNEWLPGGVSREQVVEGLRPLLDLPVEVVCPAHGAPTDRAETPSPDRLPDERIRAHVFSPTHLHGR
jgi:hypothetical protein